MKNANRTIRYLGGLATALLTSMAAYGNSTNNVNPKVQTLYDITITNSVPLLVIPNWENMKRTGAELYSINGVFYHVVAFEEKNGSKGIKIEVHQKDKKLRRLIDKNLDGNVDYNALGSQIQSPEEKARGERTYMFEEDLIPEKNNKEFEEIIDLIIKSSKKKDLPPYHDKEPVRRGITAGLC